MRNLPLTLLTPGTSADIGGNFVTPLAPPLWRVWILLEFILPTLGLRGICCTRLLNRTPDFPIGDWALFHWFYRNNKCAVSKLCWRHCLGLLVNMLGRQIVFQSPPGYYLFTAQCVLDRYKQQEYLGIVRVDLKSVNMYGKITKDASTKKFLW